MGQSNKAICSHFHSMKQLFELDPIRIVFTGDSISYNRYDFDPISRTNGYDCYPGMQSWSFLLRDLFIQNGTGYVNGDTLAAKHSTVVGEGIIRCGFNKAYVFPQYGRVLGFTTKASSDKLIVKYRTGAKSKIVLYMLSNPLSTACRFDIYVNGKHALTVENSGENKLHQGFEPFIIELEGEPKKENSLRFENIIPYAENKASEIFLIGVSQDTVHAHMSGQGSTTCKWLDDYCQERVTSYEPDLVFMTLAANDVVLSNPEEFEYALRSVIHKVRSVKPKCEFVFVMTPPSERDTPYIRYDSWIYGKSPEVASFYQKADIVAQETNALLIDPFAVFSGIPVNKWRFDNIHFSQYGNKILADSLWNLLSL